MVGSGLQLAAGASDAAVIKRLVTQWGGKLVNDVDVNTDFVVMGKEPVVPAADKDDPIAQKRAQDAQKALDDYMDKRNQAIQLSIPIMNQNRFLYFVGYYDQAKR